MNSNPSPRKLRFYPLGALIACALLLLATTAIFVQPAPRYAQSLPRAVSLPAWQVSNVGLPEIRNWERQGNQHPQIVAAYTTLPMAFEKNRGQTDPRVKYLARGKGYTVFLTSNESVISLSRPGESAVTQALRDRRAGFTRSRKLSRPNASTGQHSVAVLRMKMPGARKDAVVAVDDLQPGKSNYFKGKDPSRWCRNVPRYGRVRYQSVYPGIDVAYHGAQQQLEFDFIVAPGARAEQIALQWTGARSIAVDGSGDMRLSSPAGDLYLHKPVAYQVKEGHRQIVDASFVVRKNQVSFVLGTYDHRRELVIDPSLSYSTYLGGTGEDEGFSIAVDSAGDAFVTGETTSINFPGAANSNAGGLDAFVTELDPTGSAVLYSTYLGGSNDEAGTSIAVDNAGNAYVDGITLSSDFPVTSGVAQPIFGGGSQDAFLAKLDPTGTPVYSTFLGGTDMDNGFTVAVDASGNAYVAGETFSFDFPVTAGSFQQFNFGHDDGFLAKVSPTGTSFSYSTYLGGSNGDLITAVAVDAAGHAYVTGDTISFDFPVVTGSFDTDCGTDGNCDDTGSGPQDEGFVAEFDTTGTSLLYSGFLGGSLADFGVSIALDSVGDAYVTGLADSLDFPTTAGVVQSVQAGSDDAFVTKVNATGTAFVFSTFLGGSNQDEGTGLALDAAGNAFLAGSTLSTDFPTLNAFQPANAGASDGFVTKLNSTGTALVYSSYLGGSLDDDTINPFIALDSNGDPYVTGDTNSSDFPVVAALQPAFAGGLADAFVAKISSAASSLPDFSVSVSPSSVTVTQGQTSAALTVTVTPINGFSSAVSLACSGAPTGAACTFNPASVTPSGSAATSSLTISTTAASAQATPVSATLSRPGRPTALRFALWLPLAGLFLLGGCGWHKKTRWRALAGTMFLCLIFLVACGGSSSGGGGGSGGGGTPTGTYTISVTGMASGTTHSAAVQVTVQ